ncbi:methyltransferase [Microlunatus capsulatus]|uniref:tRNA1(Val) A37 N6-methylase TrmN6 n=1 Tax=Microlunatus capsulatus TaxID=99117 RepID=A0ABS4ZBQ1_9ACTN|nr:methyltransferase [Microlunatus capsulatus]MBP2417613.1 tRNA1(Val) A37 N6-methylase TrmN6 [Microlunatus capsulatus]
MPDLSPDHVSALREAFRRHRYEVDAVVERMGAPAHAALGRNSTLAGARALGEDADPLAVLSRLWLLQRAVPAAALEEALPGLVGPLVTAGLLERDGDAVRAAVDVRPYASDDGASGWVVSDLSPNLDTEVRPIRPDFVLGVSSASTTLAQLTVRRPVERALDLGTGCGVQSLHLARHAGSVTATDLNPRALELAALTAALNEVDVDLRLGSLYDPVEGETFDLITTNPPYVMSPPRSDAERLAYREGSWTSDGLVEQVVRDGVRHLAEDGTLQVLANWAHVAGQDWTERVGGWTAGSGCDVHVVQREVLDVHEYVELWLADAGLAGSPDYRARYAEWLDYFEALRIEAVGMGWLLLHRAGRAVPHVRLEDWPYAVEQPLAPALERELVAVGLERSLTDEALLARRWVLAGDVVEETTGVPGEADPQHLVLRQQRGFRRATEPGTALAGILGACDGELALGTVVATVAGLLDVDADDLTAEVVPAVRQLVVDGFLS